MASTFYDTSDPESLVDPYVPPPGGGGGGGTNPTDAPPDTKLTEMQTDEGATLVLAYGQHVVAGNLVEYDYTAGPPPSLKFITALGEGPWDGVEEAYYAGIAITASASATTPGYKFHPGTLSSGTSDANQGTPQFFPSSPTYSGTAYMEVLLDTSQSVEERPDKFRGIFRCLKVANYDSTGTETDAGSYSANPARVAADILKREGLLSKIDWPSWAAWRDYCDDTISWGASTIPRFECHLAFTSPVNLPTALTLVTQTGCTHWQDDGLKIQFLPVIDDTVMSALTVATYTDSNCRNLSLINNDRRQLPTGYIARFRDIDDQYMSEVTVEYFNASLEAETGGENRTEIALPPMTRSQAERICYWRTMLDGVNASAVEFYAFADTSEVLPGDLIAVAHSSVVDLDIPETSPYIALVTETEDLPESDGPGIRRIQAKILMSTPYSDTAHTVPVA